MSKIDVKELQEKVDKACENLVRIRHESKAFKEQKEKDWAPIADQLKTHRDLYSKKKEEIDVQEADNKRIISATNDCLIQVRRDVHKEALEAQKSGDMDRVKELTIVASELSLRLQSGIILQKDFDIVIKDLDKIPLVFIENNEKIMEAIASELKKEIKSNPEKHISGILKVDKSIVKVREGHQRGI